MQQFEIKMINMAFTKMTGIPEQKKIKNLNEYVIDDLDERIFKIDTNISPNDTTDAANKPEEQAKQSSYSVRELILDLSLLPAKKSDLVVFIDSSDGNI